MGLDFEKYIHDSLSNLCAISVIATGNGHLRTDCWRLLSFSDLFSLSPPEGANFYDVLILPMEV